MPSTWETMTPWPTTRPARTLGLSVLSRGITSPATRTCKRQSSEGVRAERNPYPQLARGGGDRRWESAFQLERHDPSTAICGRVPERREGDIHDSTGKTLIPLGPASVAYCPSFFFSGRYFFSIDATIT